MNRRLKAGLATVILLAGLAAWVAWRNLQGEEAMRPDPQTRSTNANTNAEQISRGAYLARAGNCAACHTARGGAPYAGGRGIATPFGTVYSGNLTPDPSTGLGRWTAAEFWRAMHHGRSRDGRLLYPAFPYPNYSLVSRADTDDLLAYLRSLPAVTQAPIDHALRWPYSSQAALALWRALFFSPGKFEPRADQSNTWNRGAYLVNGLGHCSACHASRNLLGASAGLADADAGSKLPAQNWYAPSLADPGEAGVTEASEAELVQLLKTGVSRRAAVMGPMAEVVAGSTQHLSIADLRAMAEYLRSISSAQHRPRKLAANPPAATMTRGEDLYASHCADCHGAQGQGAPDQYPALAGNRSVTLANPRNLLQAITAGGFPPATDGNPRPYGMPAFDLPHADLAALTTWLRASWGHQAAPVSEVDVLLNR